MGHLLWSGIVPPERADAVVDRLMGETLWSGWGVRTMSSEDAAYNPLAYHNGTVWPHDNSLIALGLARYRRWPEAQRIVQRLLEAAAHLDHQLPEVFAGMPRAETPFPDRVSDRRAAAGLGRRDADPPPPGAARPRAVPPPPHAGDGGAGGAAVVGGVAAPGRRAVLRPALDRARGRRPRHGRARVRIALISPVWFPVPPTGYGGIEWIVWLLADGLVDAGARRHALRLGRLAHEGEARSRCTT